MEALSFLVLVVLAGMAVSELKGLTVARAVVPRRIRSRASRSAPRLEADSRWRSTLSPCSSCP